MFVRRVSCHACCHAAAFRTLNMAARASSAVQAAVRRNGLALEYAAPALQQDRELVLEAVHQDGYALHCVVPELRRTSA